MEAEEGVKTMRGRGRGRGRGGRGRGVRGGRGGRGRAKKNVKVEIEDGENVAPPAENEEPQQEASEAAPKEIDLEADISQLEAPTFTTLNRGPPEPMLRLQWDHRVNLVAEKVLNPMIHCCDQCGKPILIYGRMIPCKHVFCLACGRREDKACPRCSEKVSRVEQTNLGTVFMCTHGGTRYNSAGCRRTYLSQRDLQAHINHRHMGPSGAMGSGDAPPEPPSPAKIPIMGGNASSVSRLKAPQSAGDPRVQTTPTLIESHHPRRSPPPPPPSFVSHRPPIIMSSSMRTNLITVQIQDSGMEAPPSTYHQQHYSHGPPPPQYGAPPYGVPPPVPIPPPQAPQFYPPNPPSTYAPPPGPPQAPPVQYPAGPPAPRPPHYPDPLAQPYTTPPPQWQHPPPSTGQPFYR